jgi:hypothetical protein
VKLEVRKGHKGFCSVLSTIFFRKGSIVHALSLVGASAEPTRTSIEVAVGVHAEDEIGKYINHACNPTCHIQGDQVIAIQNIHPGDEITFDYTRNETCMAAPFLCDCCGKLIRGKTT